MRAWHLILSNTGEAASPLYFLDRSDATRYQKSLLVPWENLGYFQLGKEPRIPLSELRLKVDNVSLPGIYAADLNWVVWRKQSELGYAPLIPGRCFDVSSWRAVTESERRDPVVAPLIAEAERELNGNTSA